MKGKTLLLLGACAPAGAHAEVLLDTISIGTYSAGVLSQDTYLDGARFDVINVEDFVTTRACRITSISAGFSNYHEPFDFSGFAGWRVEIYSSRNSILSGLRGDVASLRYTNAQTTFSPITTSDLKVSFKMSLLLKPFTRYYFGVMAVQKAETIGNALLLRGWGGDGESMVYNPGGGFGYNGNRFQRDDDAAYRVEASEPVPEPATVVVLGIGLAAIGRRRKAKSPLTK